MECRHARPGSGPRAAARRKADRRDAQRRHRLLRRPRLRPPPRGRRPSDGCEALPRIRGARRPDRAQRHAVRRAREPGARRLLLEPDRLPGLPARLWHGPGLALRPQALERLKTLDRRHDVCGRCLGLVDR